MLRGKVFIFTFSLKTFMLIPLILWTMVHIMFFYRGKSRVAFLAVNVLVAVNLLLMC